MGKPLFPSPHQQNQDQILTIQNNTNMATAKISNENQAALKALINEAAGKVAFGESIVKQGHTATKGLLWNLNRNQKDLVLLNQHEWLGFPGNRFPSPVPYGRATFVLQGPRGSKAGVVYADGCKNTDRKWLVAFDSIDNKVYVEAGPIGPTDWENVEVRLDRSGPESSSVDPVYGGKAYAEIHQAVIGSIVYVWFSN